MDRVIVNPDVPSDVDGRYRMALAAAITEARESGVMARSTTLDWGPDASPKMHADLSVRQYSDPYTGDRRYALVLEGQQTIMVDFSAKRHAFRRYEHVVKRVEQDPDAREGSRAHAWDYTDVRGVPSNCN